jgi:putative MATE family efflux protein
MTADSTPRETTDLATKEGFEAREEFLSLPVGRLLARHASPAVASMLFLAFYQIVDGIMVGRSLGPEALASVNVLYPVVALISGLAVMIGTGGNARIAVLLGAGHRRQAGGVLATIIGLGVVLGIVGTLAAIFLMPQLLAALGTSGSLERFAQGYLNGILPFFTLMIVGFILEQSVRNDGKPNLASGVMASCAILNIGLDYLFLFVLGFGISGAAMASGISQSIGALVFLTYFVTKSVRRRPGLRFARPDLTLGTLRAVIVNGSSELFNSVSAGITTFLFNRVILLHIGTLGVAALTVVQYPIMLAVMIVMGIGSGTQPILSYNHGAGLQQRVRATLLRSTLVATSVGVVVFSFMGAPARALAAVFLPDYLEAQALTHEVASIVRWSVPFMPIAMIASVYFTALEQAGRSLLIALSRGLVLPIIGLVVFPFFWGATGIWITAIFAEALSVLVAVACYLFTADLAIRRPSCHSRPTVPLSAVDPE